MTVKQLLYQRLHSQLFLQQPFSDVASVVGWLGAVQAQDYPGSLWAIGMRMKNVTENDIEQAVLNREIVRSWPMRGTLHFVAASDLRWMLKYLTPRVTRRSASLYRQAGLDEKTINKSRKVFTKELEKNGRLTRPQMYEALEKNRISTEATRGLHLLAHHAQEGLICFSGRIGKQQSFALLEDWVPAAPMYSEEEAFSRLCHTYFRSHGPATADDFAWWSGLTKKETQRAIASLGGNLIQTSLGVKTFYATEELPPSSPRSILLVPPFDEIAVAYRDRSEILSPEFTIHSGNGIFSGAILINGRIEGTWKRKMKKNGVAIEVTPFRKFAASHDAGLKKRIKELGRFLNEKVSR